MFSQNRYPLLEGKTSKFRFEYSQSCRCYGTSKGKFNLCSLWQCSGQKSWVLSLNGQISPVQLFRKLKRRCFWRVKPTPLEYKSGLFSLLPHSPSINYNIYFVLTLPWSRNNPSFLTKLLYPELSISRQHQLIQLNSEACLNQERPFLWVSTTVAIFLALLDVLA